MRYGKPTATAEAITKAQEDARIPATDRPTFDKVMAPHMQRLLDEGKVVVMMQNAIRIDDKGKRIPFQQPRYVENDPTVIAQKRRQGFVDAEPVNEEMTRWVLREKQAAAGPPAPQKPPIPPTKAKE